MKLWMMGLGLFTVLGLTACDGGSSKDDEGERSVLSQEKDHDRDSDGDDDRDEDKNDRDDDDKDQNERDDD